MSTALQTLINSHVQAVTSFATVAMTGGPTSFTGTRRRDAGSRSTASRKRTRSGTEMNSVLQICCHSQFPSTHRENGPTTWGPILAR